MKLNNALITLLLSINSYKIYAGGPIEPVMVTIPGGHFEMGSTSNERAQPIHSVAIKEFSLGKYEVTVSEFRRFIEATNYTMPQECAHELNGWFSRGMTKGNWEVNGVTFNEFQPVVCAGWNAADAYVKWLAKETGKPYRLPTEAEWEYAARAGTKTDYYFGDDKDGTVVCEYENTSDLSGENILQRDSNTSYHNWSAGLSNCTDHSGYASIVGMYKPNPFGLHDMASNVLEFLADCYVEGYQGAPADGSARQAENCEERVTRGSSWHWSHFPLITRRSIPVDFAGGVDGFRIALDGKVKKQSKNTKRFLAQLNFAQQQEQKRRDAQPEIPVPVTNVKLKQEGDLVMLTWDKSSEEDIEGYRVYRNDLMGGMFKLLGANLTETQFVDLNNSDVTYDYSVVAVRKHMQSNYSKAVSTPAAWIAVPGRVEAQSLATYSGTTIYRTSDVDGEYNLTGPSGIGEDAVIEYQLDVAKSGRYQLAYRVASPRDTKGFEIYMNDKKRSAQSVKETGGYNKWQTQQGETVYLDKGKNTLTIKSLDNNWKLNWLSVKQQ